ncbi:MAG: hypothetical protein K0V04_33900, partial [Deltaproteobacteria bacterium]|nr:hypothetical protein [Deltaproteobacteria bacterium]
MPVIRDTFLAALPPALRDQAESTPDLDARLGTLCSRAREVDDVASPRPRGGEDVSPPRQIQRGLGPTDAQWIRHVAERMDPTRPLVDGLDALSVEDLYLACGCTLGNDMALAVFRTRLLGPTRAAAARATSGDQVDEVVQETMTKLLVASP